ncbi:MAG: tetratricopeptide repeat protein, partial [Pseudomonadales bacterium]|nr:tetratricopeptide repeat protein [Pseudomonadales bacterium]
MNIPAKRLFLAVLLAVMPALGSADDEQAAKYYEDALSRFEANDLEGAIVQLKNALQEDPKMIAAQVLLGKAHLRSADPAAAETALEKALELGVSRSEVTVPLAQAFYEQGHYDELIAQLQPDATATQSQRAELLVLRGHAYKMLGQREEAAQTYRRARAADPRYVPSILSEADLLAEEGKRDDAGQLIEQALALAPNDPAVWTRKASVAHAYGDVTTALAGYDRALTIDSGIVEARVGRAGLLVDLDRLEQADPDLEYLLREVPGEPRAHYLHAVVLNKRGDGDAARKALLETTAIVDALPPEVLRARIPQGLL